MIDLIIRVENEDTKNSLVTFIQQYKDNIAEFMNLLMKNNGHLADVGIKLGEDKVLEVTQIAPDKGWVLADIPSTSASENGEVVEGKEVSIVKYASVAIGDKYMVFKDGVIWVMIKDENGVPDTKIGQFKNLNDGINMFNSPEVLAQLDRVKKEIKKETKIIDKIKKADKNRAKMNVNK